MGHTDALCSAGPAIRGRRLDDHSPYAVH